VQLEIDETGMQDRRWEIGDRRWKMGDGRWEIGEPLIYYLLSPISYPPSLDARATSDFTGDEVIE